MPNELSDLINEEVAREEKGFEGVRSRALSIVSVAGVLVTILTGLLTIASTSQKAILTLPAHWSLGVALAAFVLSTVLALIINLPGRVDRTTIKSLRGFVDDLETFESKWDRRVAQFNVTYLESLRKANRFTTLMLTFAIGSQVIGAASLATTALILVAHLKS